MRITAQDLQALDIADAVIPEPEGGAHMDAIATIAALDEELQRHLEALVLLDVDTLLEQRYAKYRAIGAYQEGQFDRLTYAANGAAASLAPPFS